MPDESVPFLTVTTYDVWFRGHPGSTWRLWSMSHVEQSHAEDEAERAKTSPGASPTRETRVARRTLIVEWLDA